MVMPSSSFVVLRKTEASPYRYYGPFETHDQAQQYRDSHEDWPLAYVVEVLKP